jgi:hypothetical protein
MSNVLDAYNEGSNPLIDAQVWHDALRKKYPALADALLGNELTRNGGPVRPALSFILSAKDGKLRFVLSGPESAKSYFGPIDDPSEPLAAAERALQGNHGEWSMKRNGQSGQHRFK